MTKNVAFAILTASLMVVSGCAKPRYETQKYYDVPEVQTALTDFAECLKPLDRDQQVCQQGADMKAMTCETHAELAQVKCEAAAEKTYADCASDPKAFCVKRTCAKQRCDPDYSQCTRAYDIGYEACGGKVRSETKCVKNCDKVK